MTVPKPNTGHLFLVVGPSGVGKDSLLDGARSRFSDDRSVIFPTRHITRPANAGGEVHVPISEDTFHIHVRNGDFALHWGAHGLYYGVPKSIDDHLGCGCSVIVNVSRAILDKARMIYPQLTIISITTQPAILAERLRARGRESEEDIQQRLKRTSEMTPIGDDVMDVDNSVALEVGINKFIDAISCAPQWETP